MNERDVIYRWWASTEGGMADAERKCREELERDAEHYFPGQKVKIDRAFNIPIDDPLFERRGGFKATVCK